MSVAAAPLDSPNPADSPQHQRGLREEEQYRRAIEEDPVDGDYSEWLSSLDMLHESERIAAVQKVEAIVAKASDRPSALITWGDALSDLERNDEAVAKFKEAVAIDPKQTSAYFGWGRVLMAKGQFSESAARFGEAICIDPVDADYDGWFDSLEKLPNPEREKATASVIQRLGDKAGLAVAYVAWGRRLRVNGNFAEAEMKYQLASELAPENPSVYAGWGSLLLEQKQFKKAEERLRQAIFLGASAVQPSEPYENWLEALNKLSLAERVSASESLEQAIVGSRSVYIYLGLAYALRAKDRYPEAIARGEQAVAKDPQAAQSLAGTYVQWGRSLASQHEHEKAMEKFRTAARVSRDSAADAYAAWGDSLASLGRYRDAGSRYARSLQINDFQIDVYERWGQILYLQGEYEEAATKFEKAIAINHRDQLFRQWLHNVARLNNELQGTFAERLRTAIDKKEDVQQKTQAYILWGQALAERGKYEEAFRKFEQCLEFAPSDSSVHTAWADTLLTCERFGDATKHYQSAYELEKQAGREQKDTLVYRSALISKAKGAYQDALVALLSLQQSEAVSRWEVHDCLADCLYALTRFEEAENHFRQALGNLPSFSLSAYSILPKWRSILPKLKPSQQKDAVEAVMSMLDSRTDYHSRIAWVLTLIDLDKQDEALSLIQHVVDENQNSLFGSDAHYQYANALALQRRYEEAQTHFQKCLEIEPDFPYAYHNIAYYLGKLGKYAESREAWERACRCYERRLPEAIKGADPSLFFYYGAVRADIFGELDEAESILKEGLEVGPQHVESLIRLGQNCLQQGTEELADRASSEASAREYFRRAERLLVTRREDSSTRALLGDLLLQRKRYDDAEKNLRKAAVDDSSPQLDTQLGVLFSQKDDFKQAVKYFEKAVSSDPDDLDARSNLAEALFKMSNFDRAQKEYERILKITESHLDTRIGLGQLFTKLGDSGDLDSYEVAISHLEKAVSLGETKTGSKRLSKADLGATYYSLGYARVRLYEKSKSFADEEQLSAALDNFTSCTRLDPMHYKARRAVEKLTKRTRLLSPQSLIEKVGPWMIFVSAVLVFAATQTGYWLKHPSWLNHSIDSKLYSAMTLSSLALAIVGLYLPRILKLKVAGIEIEKSSVEQISKISQPLNIS